MRREKNYQNTLFCVQIILRGGTVFFVTKRKKQEVIKHFSKFIFKELLSIKRKKGGFKIKLKK